MSEKYHYQLSPDLSMFLETKTNKLKLVKSGSNSSSNITIEKYDVDVLQTLLDRKNSPNTQKAYRTDLILFFKWLYKGQPFDLHQASDEFVRLPKPKVVTEITRFLAHSKLSEATINRRIASIKALFMMALVLQLCDYSLDEIKGKPTQKYRDTTGVTVDVFKQALALCDTNTPTGLRDYALLHLLWSNALRRGEVTKLTIEDLDVENKTLRIYGKGKGGEGVDVTLSNGTLTAIVSWLSTRSNLTPDSPLFIGFKFTAPGSPLSTNGIYQIVQRYFEQVTNKKMSPHRIRHSAITAALDSTDGDVRSVQKLSRHAKIETLLLYDDNRTNPQGDLTNSLADMLD